MSKIPATKRVFTICVLTIFILQIYSFSLPLLTNFGRDFDSSMVGSKIPKLKDSGNINRIIETPKLKNTAYIGPPNQNGNSILSSITINSDAEFASTAVSQGWEGTGIQYDPYLIVNINFTIGTEVSRLILKDTSSHFVIQNCVFDSATNLTILHNVTNGVIKENYYEGASNYGLYIDTDSQYIRVIHNTFINTPTGGVNVYNNNSRDNNFRYNYFDDHSPLNQPFGGIYWTDPYLLNGTGTDLTPRVHIKHFNVDELIISSNPQLDTKAYELGWLGNGTVDNPYLLTNYNLSFAMETPLIGIMDTSGYLNITNCYFNGGTFLTGAFITGSSNIQIINSSMENCQTGVEIYSSNNINITETEINNSGENGLHWTNVNNSFLIDVSIFKASHNGIYLQMNQNITVNSCQMENITFRGLFIQDSQWITVDECLIQKNYAINSGGIRTDRTSHIIINNTQIHNISRYAIYLYSTHNLSVDLTNISHNYEGIFLYRSNDCNFTRSNLWNSSYNGVGVDPVCSNNYFSFLNVFNCSTGILLVEADGNHISQNIIHDNDRGVHLWGQEGSIYNNNVSRNIIIANREVGILNQNGVGNNFLLNTIEENGFELSYGGLNVSVNSDNNTIVGNIFLNNIAWDGGSNNSWDNGTHGNYWDDYSGVDLIAPFGIGDTPYQIDGPANSTDRFPILLGVEEVAITLLTPANNSVIKSSTPLDLIVEGCLEFTYNWYGVNNYTVPVDTVLSFPEEEGPYNLTIYATSGSGGWLIKKYCFVVDNTPPIMFPYDEITNGSEVGTGNSIPFSIIDRHYEMFWFYWNNSQETTPVTYTNIPWVEAPLKTGFWTLNLFSNDTAGNQEYETINLNVLTATQISLLYPNGGEIVGGIVDVSWYSSENLTYNLYYSADSGFSWIQLSNELTEMHFDWVTVTTRKTMSSILLNGSTFLVRVVSITPGKPGEIRSESVFTILNIIRKQLPVGTTELKLPDINISITVSEVTNVTIQRLTFVYSVTKTDFFALGLFVEVVLDNPDSLEILIISFSVEHLLDTLKAQGLTIFDIGVYFYNETTEIWESADTVEHNNITFVVIGTFDHTTTIGALGKTREPTPSGNFGPFFLLILLVVGSVGAGALLVYDHQLKTQAGTMSYYTQIEQKMKKIYITVKKRFDKEG